MGFWTPQNSEFENWKFQFQIFRPKNTSISCFQIPKALLFYSRINGFSEKWDFRQVFLLPFVENGYPFLWESSIFSRRRRFSNKGKRRMPGPEKRRSDWIHNIYTYGKKQWPPQFIRVEIKLKIWDFRIPKILEKQEKSWFFTF